MRKIFTILLILFPALLFPQPAFAHAFGAMYTLPIPFWLYSYAAIGALMVSFLIIGFFFRENKIPKAFSMRNISKNSLVVLLTSKRAVLIYKVISLFLFWLTILTGLFGEDISAYNFNMTFFWVIFVLGLTYLTFFLGYIWSVLNPWQIMVAMFETLTKQKITGKIAYPKAFGYYPAFILYLLFIVTELFLRTTPFSLSIIILEYTFITFFAIYLFGKDSWFQYGEFFSVFFRYISYTSLLTTERGKTYLRLPFVGLIDKRAKDFSVLLFILFMLSSTAFDGFRETNAWATFFYTGLSPLLTPVLGDAAYQVGSLVILVLSPFFFCLLYLLVITIMKYWVRTKLSIKELAFSFAFSLVPIALVYNIAHYFTLLLIQGQEIIRLVSDPLGYNWNLFGTAGFSSNAGIIDAATVWHAQVAFILLGHIVSVFIAHLMALKIFPSHRVALRSQLPMLVLMIIYTVIGLWILSQPLTVG